MLIFNAVISKTWYKNRLKYLCLLLKGSMASISFWAYFKYCTEEGRLHPTIPSENNEVQISPIKTLYPVPDDLYDRVWYGISIICSFGNCHQLPSVEMKSLSDLSTPPKLHTADM